jgi:hypothetical protein
MADLVTLKPRRGELRLVPATPADLEVLDKVRPERPLRTRVTFDRSSPHNRWFHGLLGVVADGIGMHPAQLKAELKWKCGLVKNILSSPSFGIAIEFKSVAFGEMDEIEFTQFRQIAVEVLFRDYLPGVKRRDVWKRVDELMGYSCPWSEAA